MSRQFIWGAGCHGLGPFTVQEGGAGATYHRDAHNDYVQFTATGFAGILVPANTTYYAGIRAKGVCGVLHFYGADHHAPIFSVTMADVGVELHRISVRNDSLGGAIEKDTLAGWDYPTGWDKDAWHHVQVGATPGADGAKHIRIIIDGGEMDVAGNYKKSDLADTTPIVGIGFGANRMIDGACTLEMREAKAYGDFIIDDTGFPGVHKVVTHAVTGVVDNTGWDVNPTAVAPHEAVSCPPSTSQYLLTRESGQRIRFNIADLPEGVTHVHGLQIHAAFRRDGSPQISGVQLSLWDGDTEHPGDTQPLPHISVDPASGIVWRRSYYPSTWTADQVADLVVGVKTIE